MTDRQRDVFELVLTGLTNSEIAGRLHLSPLTVRDYVSRLLAKFGTRNRSALIITVTAIRRTYHRRLRPPS
ncbi:MAG: response regulator transcription factor [Dehalococcoidia bacterium]